MSRLLNLPATWPWLALNPEPLHSSSSPESIERWYQELFGADSESSAIDARGFRKLEPAPVVTSRPGNGYRPTAHLVRRK